MGTQTPCTDWISEHRDRWARKPALRVVYGEFFRRLREACVPGTSVMEIGCGPGFFKEFYPEVLATDAVPNRYADRVVDAAALPFGDGELGNVVSLDVFHHLPHPEQFLREVARTLQAGGHLVMIEPWMGVAGRLIFRYVHHEDCDLRVDPATPWGKAEKDPMHGNAALPYVYFRAGGYLEQMRLPLRVIERKPFAGVPWILSGGFQPLCLLPPSMVGLAEKVDRWLSLLPALTAARCLLVIEKAQK